MIHFILLITTTILEVTNGFEPYYLVIYDKIHEWTKATCEGLWAEFNLSESFWVRKILL